MRDKGRLHELRRDGRQPLLARSEALGIEPNLLPRATQRHQQDSNLRGETPPDLRSGTLVLSVMVSFMGTQPVHNLRVVTGEIDEFLFE